MLLVPLSPHALFGRALVVGPQSVSAVEVLTHPGHRACWGATAAAPTTCRAARA